MLNLYRYLTSFGVSCSPLIGRAERLKYINQVSQPEEWCLPRDFSQFLTPACLIDGMNDQQDEAITFGKEPCYTIEQNGCDCICPFFEQCPGTKMLRDCYTSSVVLTTVAGFAASRVGEARETFLELAVREKDVILFDESDRAQKTLDQLFMPETSFNSYIKESAEDSSAYMRQSSIDRERNSAIQHYNEMQHQSVTILSCLIKSLRKELDTWERLKYGDTFSALMLLEDLRDTTDRKYQISLEVYRALYWLIDQPDVVKNQDNTLWATYESSCKSIDSVLFDELYQKWKIEQQKKDADRKDERISQIQDARIKLIIQLIYFDHFIQDLHEAYQTAHETSYGQNELFGFLQTRFRTQQFYLPSALCGNLFGLKKTEEEDIIVFLQYSFCRITMNELPYPMNITLTDL